LGLDLTIGLIHAIAQQIQKIQCEVASVPAPEHSK